MGIRASAGTLEVEILVDLIRLKQQLDQAQGAVGGASGQMAMKAQVAAKAVGEIGASSSAAFRRAEREGEGVSKMLERQIVQFGKTASEVRDLRAMQAALNAEQRGMPDLAQRLRAQVAEMQRLEGAGNKLAGRGSGTLTQLSFQLNDIATMAAMGAPPMQIFASQAGQIFQVAQAAEGGVRGFASSLAIVAVQFAPIIIAAAAAGTALFQWHKQINDDAGLKQYAVSLGLTHKEMKRLGDQTVTYGDMMRGFWQAINEAAPGGQSLMSRLFTDADKKALSDLMDFALNVFKAIGVAIYGLFVGSYRAVIETWRMFPAALADIFVQAVNAAIGKLNGLGEATNRLLGVQLFGSIKPLENQFAGTAKKVGDIWRTSLSGAVAEGAAGIDGIIKRTAANAERIRKAEMAKKAAEIIADRTPKTDSHAAALQREAEATEAQIRNLYRLADAYGISGGAALIAEARVKSESAAIKSKGDIDAFVDRQIRVAVAQRVSDAAKSTAAMRDEADATAGVNAMVAAGLVPAARAADLVRDRLADLPLLAAIEAAQQRGLKVEADRATKALEDQQAARARLSAQQVETKFNSDMASGRDHLAMLQEELRLVGSTDQARGRALTTIKATQEAIRNNYDPAQLKQYVDQQVALADATLELEQAQAAYNETLRASVNHWTAIDEAANRAADGISDAFGRVGSAIGDTLTSLTDYVLEKERLTAEEKEQIERAGDDFARQESIKREYAIRTAGMQVEAYGDMASAAKQFFKEGSDGYKVLSGAEKTFRAIQFALSVKAVAQDVIATATSIANSGARAAAGAVEAVVNAIKSLPFPLNLAAGAATVGALASLGLSIAGSFGGGGNDLAKANGGKGTVLGDSDAQSKSLERAIDLVRDVDTVTMNTSRAMLDSLRNIEANIGNLASLLVRTGNIDASAGVETGFKTDLTGKMLGGDFIPGLQLAKQLPILGDLLGGLSGVVKSLFGTKTSVIASGLFGGPQAIADVLNAGFDASYFSDVKKTKKFLGVSAGSKYSTQYTDASSEIEQQFGLILQGFYETIAKAAPALDTATGEVEDRLSGFIVDIGKIDLKGLTGEEISEKLQAVFGAAADDMARAAIPGLERFQAVGEGMFETLVRVAMTVETVSTSLGRLGANAQGLSIDSSMALAGLFDSVSDLSSAASSYFEGYFTEAEQVAIRTGEMGKAFASLGLAMPDTIASFRSLVEAQDLNTDAGRSAYAILLQLAPAFADLQQSMGGVSSAADILRERQDLERQLLELSGDTAAIRADDLAKLDASNRALQEHIWALQDQQKATEAATAAAEQAAAAEKQRAEAIASERTGLERRLLDAVGDTAAVRQLEINALAEVNRPLLLRLYALQDEQAATEALTKAQAEAAEVVRQRAATVASERDGLERQLLDAMGDTAAIRALELAAIDESNRALQQRLWELADEKTAMEAAAQAAADTATKLAAIVSERAGLERQLLEAQGATAAIRALELAALDESNRAIQTQIWALADQKDATDAAAQAASEAASREQALATQRDGLERQIMELVGDTAGIRARELAALDPSLVALQRRIYQLQDEQAAAAEAQRASEAAAQAAEQLADAWKSVADSIMDEVARIRGESLTDPASYAQLQGQFNAATDAARRGDQEAAKNLPGLSKSMLDAAALVATSRQELLRVQGMTAASLEQTAKLIGWVATQATTPAAGMAAGSASGGSDWWAAIASSALAAGSGSASNDNADMVAELRALRAEVAQLRQENNSGHAANASVGNRSAKVLERAQAAGGGDGLAVAVEAA